ncbi:hypothetical protein BaRGS_00019279 [Batillaria attramentaria]|uniref:CUB domain-containing protein n=1 Tax=Batillaria attramentaria TaxID=370345 RepID=A0ABD0KQE1_9CAEN
MLLAVVILSQMVFQGASGQADPADGQVGGACTPGDATSCLDPNAACSGPGGTCQCTSPFQTRPSDRVCVYSQCGGTLTQHAGTVVSPDLTTVPTEGAECEWTFPNTDPDHFLNMQLSLTNFEWSPNCLQSVLEVGKVR